MAEGNLLTHVLQRFPVNHAIVAGENPLIEGLAIDVNGIVTSGVTVIGFAETNLPVPLPVAGQVVQVTTAFDGLCQGVAGAAFAVGTRLTVSSGQVVTAAAGQFVIGRAMSAATAAGQKVQVLITREGNA